MVSEYWGSPVGAEHPSLERQYRNEGSTLFGTLDLLTQRRCDERPDLETFVRLIRDKHPRLFGVLPRESLVSAWVDMPTLHFRTTHILDAIQGLEARATVFQGGRTRVGGGGPLPPEVSRQIEYRKDYPKEEEDGVDIQLGTIG